MIFLEGIKSRLTAAVMLRDELTETGKAVGDVYLKVAGAGESPLLHSTGYFLLIDVPEGTYDFTVGGSFYKEIVRPQALKQSQLFYPISLEPRANYPFPEGLTVLKGKVIAEDKAVSGAVIEVKDMAESSISEDDGWFFIIFKTINADKDITLKLSKDGYKAAEGKVTIRKGVTTRYVPIIMIKQ